MTEDEKSEFILKLLIGKKKGGTITEWAEVGRSIVGALVEDECKPIKTSALVKIHKIGGQEIAETLNSYYYLIEKGTAYDFYNSLGAYQRQNEQEHDDE